MKYIYIIFDVIRKHLGSWETNTVTIKKYIINQLKIMNGTKVKTKVSIRMYVCYI